MYENILDKCFELYFLIKIGIFHLISNYKHYYLIIINLVVGVYVNCVE